MSERAEHSGEEACEGEEPEVGEMTDGGEEDYDEEASNDPVWECDCYVCVCIGSDTWPLLRV